MHLIRRCARENCARVLLLSWADAVASVHCVSCTLRPSVHQIAQAHGERVRKGPSFRAASHTKRRRRPPMRPQLSTAATPPREKDEGGKRRRLRGWVGLCCAAAAVIRVNASSSSSSKSSCSDRTTEGGREGAERGRGLFLQPPLLSAWPSSSVAGLHHLFLLLLSLSPLPLSRARPHIDFVKLVSQGTARHTTASEDRLSGRGGEGSGEAADSAAAAAPALSRPLSSVHPSVALVGARSDAVMERGREVG